MSHVSHASLLLPEYVQLNDIHVPVRLRDAERMNQAQDNIKYRKVECVDAGSSIQWSERADTPLEKRLSWSAPLVMFGALLTATAFAVGHDRFYAYHDQKQVQASSFSQAWISNFGTGFAFLVKTFTALASGTAYIDTMFAMPRDITAISNIGLWLYEPVLALLAIIPWLMPFAATVTPGTLSVEAIPQSSIGNASVPYPYYNWTEFGTYSGQGIYAQATTALVRLVHTSSTSGAVLEMTPSIQNTSYFYSTHFHGPGITCMPASQEVKDNAQPWVQPQEDAFTYISFVPGDTTHDYSVLNSSSHVITPVDGGGLYRSRDYVSPDAMRIYIILDSSVDSTFECNLGNFSYDIDVQFAYREQQTIVTKEQMQNNVSANWATPDSDPQDALAGTIFSEELSYTAIMDAFCGILVGYSQENHYGGTLDHQTLKSFIAVNWTTQETAMRGLEDLFRNVTLGILSVPELTELQQVNVTITESINIYVYQPRNLRLAYAIAIGSAFLCTLVGLYSMFKNSACYNNSFSTVFRATCRLDVPEMIEAEDSGCSPLPKHLASMRIALTEDKKD